MEDLKKDIWNLIDSNADNLSDKIGWGTMDSLVDEIIKLKHEIDSEKVTITLNEYECLRRDSDDLKKVSFSI